MHLSIMILSRADGWLTLKCFYENAPSYGEFYLRLNLQTNEAEITAKDAYYAADLIAAFARAMADRD